MLVLALAISAPASREDVALSAFLEAIDAGKVTSATIRGQRVVATVTGGQQLRSAFPPDYAGRLVELLHAHDAQIEVRSPSGWIRLLYYLLPFVLYGLFWWWLARRLPPRVVEE